MSIESYPHSETVYQKPPSPFEIFCLQTTRIVKIVSTVFSVASWSSLFLFSVVLSAHAAIIATSASAIVIISLIAFAALNTFLFFLCKGYDQKAAFTLDPVNTFEKLIENDKGTYTPKKEALFKKYGFLCKNLIAGNIKIGIKFSNIIKKPLPLFPPERQYTEWKEETNKYLAELQDKYGDFYFSADQIPILMHFIRKIDAGDLSVIKSFEQYLNSYNIKNAWTFESLQTITSYCTNLKKMHIKDLGIYMAFKIKQIPINLNIEKFEMDLYPYQHLFD